MKNFKVTAKEDGKEYWISRSVAVAVFVFTRDSDNELYVLANKRGPGTPDFQGYWNCPCGYLDYDESLNEAASREVFEETGLDCGEHLHQYYIESDPSANKQNVTVQYFGLILNPVFSKPSGGEINEVDEVQWIKISDINKYQWAFNHNQIAKEISSIWED